MRITNRYGLPGAFVEAVKNDPYNAGASDISATKLIAPPQIRTLTNKHYDDIEEDASDRVWALLGQAAHSILERAEPSAIVEERLFMDVMGWTLSGQYDRLTLRQATLQDYKISSVWEVIYGLKPEREAQLNVLAELADVNGYDHITNLEIVHVCRDWQKSKAKNDREYPQVPVKRMKVPLWDKSKRIAYIEERIALHQASENGQYIPCTDEDRWATPTKYAVMKEGRKSAVRVLETKEAAETMLKEKDSKHYLEIRVGEDKRCEDYCAVSQFCPQFNSKEQAA